MKARVDSWRAVEVAIDDGEARIGGVSNCGVKHASSAHTLAILLDIVSARYSICQHRDLYEASVGRIWKFARLMDRHRAAEFVMLTAIEHWELAGTTARCKSPVKANPLTAARTGRLCVPGSCASYAASQDFGLG